MRFAYRGVGEGREQERKLRYAQHILRSTITIGEQRLLEAQMGGDLSLFCTAAGAQITAIWHKR